MNHAAADNAYGLWSLVVINSLVFIMFAFMLTLKVRVPADDLFSIRLAFDAFPGGRLAFP